MTAKRILAPIDGSERSEEIVPLVAALARDTGATVRLLRIYPVPKRVVRDTGETISYADQEMAGLTAAGRGALEPVEARLHDVPVERMVRFGDTVEEIANEAEAFDADVIVMTGTARTGLRRVLSRGIADRVTERVTVPTLVLRLPAA
jgi:nucleotide-binding universal stress UspA family protein